MPSKPGDFFLGVIDFLGIIVPGVVFVLLHGDLLLNLIELETVADYDVASWAWLLIASYVAGHFLLGAGVPLNRLQQLFYPEGNDDFYREVESEIALPQGIRPNRQETFYRAFSFIRLKSPDAIVEVERQTAEYKLFRSLTLVFLLDIPLVWIGGSLTWTRGMVAFFLAVLALWRFVFLLRWTQRLVFEYYVLLTKGPQVPVMA